MRECSLFFFQLKKIDYYVEFCEGENGFCQISGSSPVKLESSLFSQKTLFCADPDMNESIVR